MKIESENTTVKLIEEDGITKVIIKSKDAVVFMNDDMIWSIGNEKEEFKRIPKALHTFLIDAGDGFIEFDKTTNVTTVDTYVEDEPLTFYIPTNQNENIHARFDMITSIADVKEYLSEDVAPEVHQELEAKFKEVEEAFKEKGYKLVFSHAVGEWAYAWWDMVFKVTEWNEESIREIMKRVKELNLYIHNLRASHKI